MLTSDYHDDRGACSTAAPAETLVARLVEFFLANPDQWIDGREISRVAGYGGFRSRISDLRKLGLVVINRQSKVVVAPGRRITKSEYKFVTSASSPRGPR